VTRLFCSAWLFGVLCSCQARAEPATPPVGGVEKRVAPAGESSGPDTPPDNPTHTESEARMRVAWGCFTQDDFACVVRTLEGHANTATELGLLIETYRFIGDVGSARRHMQRYVELFPSARRADAYTKILQSKCYVPSK